MQRCVVVVLLAGFVTFAASRHVDPKRTGIGIIDGLCMNVRTDRLVYRFKNDSYVYIAFDTLKTGMVDVFSWDIVKPERGTYISSTIKEERVLAIDFRKGVNREHVIGATGKRHQRQFKHRMERKMKHCRKLMRTKKKHCKLTSIHSVFLRMKIRNVTFKNDLDDCDT